jgi:hypothetical protein
MFTSPMIGELADSQRTELFAIAYTKRLTQEACHARRAQARSTTAGRVRRIWLRTTTQPAHS